MRPRIPPKRKNIKGSKSKLCTELAILVYCPNARRTRAPLIPGNNIAVRAKAPQITNIKLLSL